MKVPVKFTVTMEYEAGEDPYSSQDTAQWLADMHCHSNVAHALADLVASDDEHSVCNLCRFSEVELLPQGTPAYRGREGVDL